MLNVNAKVHGIAMEPAGCKQLICALLEYGFGIIQLPCAEQHCFGIKRWGQVKEQMNFPAFRNHCRILLQPIVPQVQDFYENGYEITAVIGLNGSPACGVQQTCTGNWGGEIGAAYSLDVKIASLGTLDEPGVMMEVLQEMLMEAKIKTKFLAADEKDPEASSQALLAQLQ